MTKRDQNAILQKEELAFHTLQGILASPAYRGLVMQCFARQAPPQGFKELQEVLDNPILTEDEKRNHHLVLMYAICQERVMKDLAHRMTEMAEAAMLDRDTSQWVIPREPTIPPDKEITR